MDRTGMLLTAVLPAMHVGHRKDSLEAMQSCEDGQAKKRRQSIAACVLVAEANKLAAHQMELHTLTATLCCSLHTLEHRLCQARFSRAGLLRQLRCEGVCATRRCDALSSAQSHSLRRELRGSWGSAGLTALGPD